MTNTQKILTLSLLLITATSIPAVQMAKESFRLKNQLQTLESRSLSLRKTVNSHPSSQFSQRPRRTVQQLLASQNEHLDARTLLKQLSHAQQNMDIMAMMRVFLPIAEMNEEQLKELLADLHEIEDYPGSRGIALQLVSMSRAGKSEKKHQQQLEELLHSDIHPFQSSRALKDWARESPAQALAWFKEKEASGDLSGKGVSDHSETYFEALLSGILESSPSQALQLYWQANENWRLSAHRLFIEPIIQRYEQSNDISELHNFIAQETDFSLKLSLLSTASESVKLLPQILEINKLDEDNLRSVHRLARAVSAQNWSFEKKAATLKENLSQEDFEARLSTLFLSNTQNTAEVTTWIHQQPDVKLRDQSFSSFSNDVTSSGQHQKAYEIAKEIQNDELREHALIEVSRHWYQEIPTAAKKHVDPEILEQIR